MSKRKTVELGPARKGYHKTPRWYLRSWGYRSSPNERLARKIVAARPVPSGQLEWQSNLSIARHVGVRPEWNEAAEAVLSDFDGKASSVMKRLTGTDSGNTFVLNPAERASIVEFSLSMHHRTSPELRAIFDQHMKELRSVPGLRSAPDDPVERLVASYPGFFSLSWSTWQLIYGGHWTLYRSRRPLLITGDYPVLLDRINKTFNDVHLGLLWAVSPREFLVISNTVARKDRLKRHLGDRRDRFVLEAPEDASVHVVGLSAESASVLNQWILDRCIAGVGEGDKLCRVYRTRYGCPSFSDVALDFSYVEARHYPSRCLTDRMEELAVRKEAGVRLEVVGRGGLKLSSSSEAEPEHEE